MAEMKKDNNKIKIIVICLLLIILLFMGAVRWVNAGREKTRQTIIKQAAQQSLNMNFSNRQEVKNYLGQTASKLAQYKPILNFQKSQACSDQDIEDILDMFDDALAQGDAKAIANVGSFFVEVCGDLLDEE